MYSCLILSVGGVSRDECICRPKRPFRLGSSMHGSRSHPLGFLSCFFATSRRVDALGHPSPGSPLHFPTTPFSHSLGSTKSHHHPRATREGESDPPPSVTTYSNGLNTTLMTDTVALYWLKSLLACRLNSAHLRGAEQGSLFLTGK